MNNMQHHNESYNLAYLAEKCLVDDELHTICASSD